MSDMQENELQGRTDAVEQLNRYVSDKEMELRALLERAHDAITDEEITQILAESTSIDEDVKTKSAQVGSAPAVKMLGDLRKLVTNVINTAARRKLELESAD